MPQEPFLRAASLLLASAGQGYAFAVRRACRALAQDPGRGDALQAAQRLARSDRLSPEAAFILVAVGQALHDAGAFRALRLRDAFA